MTKLQRTTVTALDNILGKEFPVLDHGFIRLIDYMGDDSAIVQAARVSYGTGTKKLTEDAGLIRYLRRHDHTTPFEMAEVKLHLRMPIFIMRQWIRHRTANVNEYSARYSIVKDKFYIPNKEDLAPQSKVNKQGREGNLSKEQRDLVHNIILEHSNNSYDTYEALLGDKKALLSDVEKTGLIETSTLEKLMSVDLNYEGISRELARICLPANVYTECYWKIDLHNLLHFLRLRMHPHAQYEIREFATTIYNQIVKPWVPLTCEAFEDCVINSKKLTRQQYQILKDLLSTDKKEELVSKYKSKEEKESLKSKYTIGDRELSELITFLRN